MVSSAGWPQDLEPRSDIWCGCVWLERGRTDKGKEEGGKEGREEGAEGGERSFSASECSFSHKALRYTWHGGSWGARGQGPPWGSPDTSCVAMGTSVSFSSSHWSKEVVSQVSPGSDLVRAVDPWVDGGKSPSSCPPRSLLPLVSAFSSGTPSP